MLHFYGRPCNFCSGLTKLSCILYLEGWSLLRCSFTWKHIGHGFTKSTVKRFFHVFHSCATVTQIGISLLYTKPPKLQQQKTAAESRTKNRKLELTTLMVRFLQFLQNLVGWEEPKRKLLAVCHLSLRRHTNKTDRLQCIAQSNTEHNLCYTKDTSLFTTGKDLALKITLILLCYENAHLYTNRGKLLWPMY